MDFVEQVLNGEDANFSESTFDDGVVGEGNSLTVDLGKASLVDEVVDGLSGRVTIGNVGFNLSDHVHGCFVELDKGAVVELSQSEELHYLSALGVQLVNTI